MSKYLGDLNRAGVQDIVGRLRRWGEAITPDDFVQACLDQLAGVQVEAETRRQLISHASKAGAIQTSDEGFPQQVKDMLQLIAATKEYQFC